MFHKKIKTEPCLSPESPFMRKPSKEFLQKITFNRQKPKQSDRNELKSPNFSSQQNLTKISFIPTNPIGNLQSQKNQTSKFKKTTIQLGTFKIKHENLLLKSEIEEIRLKNSSLVEKNQSLEKQNEQLRRELQIYTNSKISKFSEETLQQTIQKDQNIGSQKILFRTRESLEVQSYEILPTLSKISNSTSMIFEEEFKDLQDCNFLSSSISRKFKPKITRQKVHNQKEHFLKIQIQMLSNRISFLQKQLQKSLLRGRSLSAQNESLQLFSSLSKRKIDMKDSQIKDIKMKQKKKMYIEKLFQLSSQEDNQNFSIQRHKKSTRKCK